MDEIGHILREARENKGLTHEDVQDETRINAAYLEALENGAYDALPSPVHVRGFMRNYARFLGLDPAPLLERYKPVVNHEPPPRVEDGNGHISFESPLPARQDQPFFDPVNVEVDGGARRDPEGLVRLLIIAALIAALALVANRFLPMILNDGEGGAVVTESITGAVDSILNREEGETAANSGEGQSDGEPDPALDLVNSGVITSTSRTNSGAEVLPTASPTRPALPATLDEIVLKLEVTERTWLEATIDDEVQFSGIARAGDTFEWTAAEEAKLLTGNAIGVFVTINDIPLGRLGDRGQNIEEVWQTTR